MEWKGRRKSENVEDRRGKSPAVIGGGLGGIGIIIVIIYTLLGGNPSDILGGTDPTQVKTETASNYKPTAEEEEIADFVQVILADTEDVWASVFTENNLEYKNPTLVLYTNSVSSACGNATAAVGPFYCPGDQKLYIDLSFYDELRTQYKAPGDFAMAYVVAHEVGHHVQTLLGTSQKVNNQRNKISQKAYNDLSVRLELQADYYAGVFAKHVQGEGYLDRGDFQEALTAAQAIGDDTLQKKAQGYAVPDSFTHGTSKQRMTWLEKGYEYGDIQHGDTFKASNL
ncbi:KPN_02809 family neutral zinc metallopeptidase [Kurthia sibirica]|uniref:Metalloprotease n=1 Tax=Kurthia sibirica TaxID=202750 RepID=A0A2U3AKL0_9BACL|nr:neutral zinc metallopeptidase [Kurthia sibirica]PWI25044.1 metalloprotease [Kurthia sibirica]GEK34208.1 metalloprotease [Kurthia sibirica]